MTTTERSETPRTDEFKRALSELLEDSPKSREHLWETACGDFERELTALRLRLDEQQVFLEGEHDCRMEAEKKLDELRLRYTWKPMKDAPRDRDALLFRFPSGLLLSGYDTQYIGAVGWMEIP